MWRDPPTAIRTGERPSCGLPATGSARAPGRRGGAVGDQRHTFRPIVAHHRGPPSLACHPCAARASPRATYTGNCLMATTTEVDMGIVQRFAGKVLGDLTAEQM